MSIKSKLPFLLTAFLLLGAVACTDDPGADEVKIDDSAVDDQDADGSKALKIDGRVFSVPSPAQTALMLKNLGMGYDKGLSASPELASQLTSKEEKALLMGMYGADLAYSVSFQDGQTGITMFKAIEGVAADLSLENAVDKNLVDRFMSNVGNDDSLLVLSGVAYRAADQYLKRNDRNDISSLVLAGGWLETMHIALAVYAAEENEELAQRIAEQRSALNNLVSVMESSSTNQKVSDLISGLGELNQLFQAVPVSYDFEEPATDVANKTTFINSKSNFDLEGSSLQSISEKVTSLREMILS